MAKKDEKREYEDFKVNFTPKTKCNNDLRKEVVNVFLDEKCGYWRNDTKIVTRYKYFVEKLEDGRSVYLLRPAYLNKGIDFQVTVERFKNGKDARPSHKDIFSDLKLKKSENPEEFKQLLKAIKRVWDCEDLDTVRKQYNFSFREGFSVELILKVLKWLFIEQDITYSNYDGRGMLYRAILDNSL